LPIRNARAFGHAHGAFATICFGVAIKTARSFDAGRIGFGVALKAALAVGAHLAAKEDLLVVVEADAARRHFHLGGTVGESGRNLI
jgi:hypothetical protein